MLPPLGGDAAWGRTGVRPLVSNARTGFPPRTRGGFCPNVLLLGLEGGSAESLFEISNGFVHT